jgi:hypothetical protein
VLPKVQEQKVELGFASKSLLVGVGWILVSGMNDNLTVKNLYRSPRQLNESNNYKFLSRGAVRSNNRRCNAGKIA